MVSLVWGPPKRRAEFHVLIPSNFAADAAHLREKTLRIGFLCRALAAFRVDQLVVYHENPEKPEESANLIKIIADYMNTAPYLRRHVFKLRKELKYAGLLPPLNIPTHPPSRKPPEDAYELREGIVVKRGPSYFVEAGLDRALPLRAEIRPGTRVILLTKMRGGKLKYRVISKSKLNVYLGFKSAVYNGKLAELVKQYDLKIATSRLGGPVTERLDEVSSLLKERKKICIAFGSYRNGLKEICEVQGAKLEELFDVTLNLVPHQGVRTVRTEEAVYATLAILNLISG